MWLIEGPFDGKPGEVEHKKLKLLKCGSVYQVGRKPKQHTKLIIAHPKISHDHAVITVKEHGTSDVSDPSTIPSLCISHSKDRGIQVHRDNESQVVPPGVDFELKDGDNIALVTSFRLTVRWKPVCCFTSPNSSSFAFDKCATMGIKLIATPHAGVTHHLSSSLNVAPSLLTSMLAAAQVVRPEWLTEFLRQGELEKETGVLGEGRPLTTLESEFIPPAEAKYRPPFAPNLSPKLKTFRTWEANEERVGMLKGWRFLFVGEKGREADTELVRMIEAGGAEYEVFDVTGGERKWKQTLDRNKRKATKGLSVYANVEMMKTAAAEDWDIVDEVLRESNMRFIDRSNLFDAVLYLDSSRIDSALLTSNEESGSSLSLAPNTHPDEPSVPPESIAASANVDVLTSAEAGPSKRQLRRRGTASSRAGSAAPEAPEQTSSGIPDLPQETSASTDDLAGASVPTTRKPLVRRSKTMTGNALDTVIVGVDDPSIIDSQPPVIDSADAFSMPPPTITSSIAQSTLDSMSTHSTSRPNRLKRRRNGEDPFVNPVLAELQRDIEQASQIPSALKRFKALFDETDPDRQQSQSGAILSGSIAHDQVDAYSLGVTQSGVAETQFASQTESEETQVGRTSRKVPRRLPPVAEEVEESQRSNAVPSSSVPAVIVAERDTEINVEDAGDSGPRPASSAAPAPSQPPVTIKTKAKSNAGAAPGKPDTDAVFLKAIASTKKGKKHEDDFDREFNNLRISKPDIEKEVEVKQWDLLADFGDDGDVRGNFMVIIEMDVPERESRRRRDPDAGMRPEWRDKPNFKRFRKKHVERSRNPVELVADDDNDFGMGSQYWKGVLQGQSQSQSQGEDINDVSPLPSQVENKVPASGRASKAPSKSRTQSQAPRRGRSRSVLLDVDSDQSDEGMQAPARSRRGTQANGKGKGKAQTQALFLPDEDDDEPDATMGDTPSGEIFDLDIGDVSVDEDEDDAPTKRGKGGGQSSATARKRPAVLMDDDSDTAFKGFGTRKKTRNK